MFKRTEFERVTPESVGIASEDIMWLLDQLESGFTEPHGLMIMRHGKICAEGWWAPFAPGIRHGEQSHSKTYAATAAGIAYTEGILELDEWVVDIFPDQLPEEVSENLKRMTVRDVLCMGCGMDRMPQPTKDWIRDFLAIPVEHVPGTAYMYNSVGSTLIGAIVREKTGMGLQEYLKPRLYDKIGIDCENHRWMKMPDGMEVGGGGLFATTEDNLRLMKLYADGGVWDGDRILAAEYVKMATTLQNASASEEKKNPLAKDNFVGYGFQIWMCRPKGVYRADGAMGQYTIVVPDLDMILAITENAGSAHWAQSVLDTMWEFLERVKANSANLENTEATGRLKDRMNRLSLPREKYAPYSPTAAKFQDQVFTVVKGEMRLTDWVTENSMAGKEAPKPVDSFWFSFRAMECTLHYVTEGQEHTVNIAMDGSRRYAEFEDTLNSQALMNAYWEGENELHVVTRWIETCSRQERIFRFQDGKVEMETKGNLFLGGPEPIVTALMQEEKSS
ncbi:MAG: serine hydrolase [Coprococcus sp.]|nr:serine hydrolase [Coprococcus sp.]